MSTDGGTMGRAVFEVGADTAPFDAEIEKLPGKLGRKFGELKGEIRKQQAEIARTKLEIKAAVGVGDAESVARLTAQYDQLQAALERTRLKAIAVASAQKQAGGDATGAVALLRSQQARSEAKLAGLDPAANPALAKQLGASGRGIEKLIGGATPAAEAESAKAESKARIDAEKEVEKERKRQEADKRRAAAEEKKLAKETADAKKAAEIDAADAAEKAWRDAAVAGAGKAKGMAPKAYVEVDADLKRLDDSIKKLPADLRPRMTIIANDLQADAARHKIYLDAAIRGGDPKQIAALTVEYDQLLAKVGSVQKATNIVNGVPTGGRNVGGAVLEISRAVEDAQYGAAGVLNNIPGIIAMLGGPAGLAGVISLVAVGITVLARNWGKFAGEISNDEMLSKAGRSLEGLQDAIKKLKKEMEEVPRFGTAAALEQAEKQAKARQRADAENAKMEPDGGPDAEARREARNEAVKRFGGTDKLAKILAQNEIGNDPNNALKFLDDTRGRFGGAFDLDETDRTKLGELLAARARIKAKNPQGDLAPAFLDQLLGLQEKARANVEDIFKQTIGLGGETDEALAALVKEIETAAKDPRLAGAKGQELIRKLRDALPNRRRQVGPTEADIQRGKGVVEAIQKFDNESGKGMAIGDLVAGSVRADDRRDAAGIEELIRKAGRGDRKAISTLQGFATGNGLGARLREGAMTDEEKQQRDEAIAEDQAATKKRQDARRERLQQGLFKGPIGDRAIAGNLSQEEVEKELKAQGFEVGDNARLIWKALVKQAGEAVEAAAVEFGVERDEARKIAGFERERQRIGQRRDVVEAGMRVDELAKPRAQTFKSFESLMEQIQSKASVDSTKGEELKKLDKIDAGIAQLIVETKEGNKKLGGPAPLP